MGSEKDIKAFLAEGKTVSGAGEVSVLMKKGKLKKIFFASNCPDDARRDIDYYAKLSSTETENFDGDSTKLAQICGKPFKISVLGIKK